MVHSAASEISRRHLNRSSRFVSQALWCLCSLQRPAWSTGTNKGSSCRHFPRRGRSSVEEPSPPKALDFASMQCWTAHKRGQSKGCLFGGGGSILVRTSCLCLLTRHSIAPAAAFQ